MRDDAYMEKAKIQCIVCLGLIVVLTGCGRKTAHDTTPTTNVAIDGTPMTNVSSVTNANVTVIPTEFPKDIFVIEGTVSSVTVSATNTFATIMTSQKLADVRATYSTHVKADGWTLQSTVVLGHAATIIAKKDTRTLTVAVTDVDGGTRVVLTSRTVDAAR